MLGRVKHTSYGNYYYNCTIVKKPEQAKGMT